eukprot:TRINITY_DN11762_c0_g3_i2.p1 TRINITY_DN11762_c0_g3~~TRINITY_DN11762_c0_g3_i2.p1  ORF type:complete len:866 (+),score=135.37 TRINITY_DN11762_c0_g3_i2:53-2650(+)
MANRGPPRPRPLNILKGPSNTGSVVPDPPQELILKAISDLKRGGGDEASVRNCLNTLQVVVWKTRKDHGSKWSEVDKKDPVVSKLEEAWKLSLTVAISGNNQVCRICDLVTNDHPFCSKTGQRHPAPSTIFPEYNKYKRSYILPGKVKEMLGSTHLKDLVEIMHNNMDHLEVLVFGMMVVTETTSPKLAVDANKKELLDLGIIEIVIEAAKRYTQIEIVAQDICAVLRNLLTHIPTNAQFEKLKGSEHLIKCARKYPMNQELVHRACGCLLIIASRGTESRQSLFKLDVVTCLIQVLNTPHGRDHLVRRLVVSTFQKLIKSIDRAVFREVMESEKGFTVINNLYATTHDDDRAGLQEILEVRGDLPRGTFVDPKVLVIDDKGDIKRESFVKLLKSNEHRDYVDDPPTPKTAPLDWPVATCASPLFPSPPSFGAADFDEDGDDVFNNAMHQKQVTQARTPGGVHMVQSTLPDVAMADEDLAMYTQQTSHHITTPSTQAQIESDAGLLPLSTPSDGTAKQAIEFLESNFTAKGTFARPPDYCKKLFKLLDALLGSVTNSLKNQPKLIDMKAPVYVFGDIHGNFGDLHYFMKHLLVFNDPAYTPFSFLFVGDYVDRGKWGPEVMAYLLAYKVLAPQDFHLLRGNHEDVAVNGDVEMYGNGSLRSQMMQCFSATMGPDATSKLFNKMNCCFKYFPIAAVIDNKIFATHGGIPRFLGGKDDRLEVLRDPTFAAFDDFILPINLDLNVPRTRQHVYAHDCIWSDPSGDHERLDGFGFGVSQRGGQVVSYGQAAIHQFLDNTGLEFIIRGHEEKADGLNISKQARVLTVFSTSDYCGKGNRGGVALVRGLKNGDLLCKMIHRAKPADQLSAY